MPIRVMEICGAGSSLSAAYAGWLLAEMGAEVHLAVDAVRSPAPTPDGAYRRVRELFARAKAEVAWPPEGAGPLTACLGSYDILLCDDPAAAERLIGDRSTLLQRFPRLIFGISTPLGLDGPLAGLPATTLDAQALSATSWSIGEPDRAPLTLPPGVVEHQAGAMLAAAALLAIEARDQGAPAQLIDLATIDVLASYVAANCRVFVHHGLKWQRSGRRPYGSCGAYPFVILPCRDGDVCVSGRTREEWQRLIKVMGDPDWASEPRYLDLRAMGTRYPEEGDARIGPWLLRHTRAELEALAVQHGLIIAPLRSMSEVIETAQFQFRGFFSAQVLRQREFAWPGLPFKVTETHSASAPDLGHALLVHDAESVSRGHALKRAQPPASAPLEGIRVLDFGWVWSAPWVSTMLAEMGAQVIKVEHGGRPDNVRLAGKVIRNGEPVPGPSREMSPMFHQINHGKLGITLNLKDPRAIGLAKELVAQSHLVIENMSPGSMDRTGLGFEALRAVNPGIVMLSMSAVGQFGPYSGMRAYAPTMSAFAGLESLVGYDGESPIGALNFAIGDPNASVHGLLGALAALRRARLTGRGCFIDLSQVEALVSTLRPFLVEAQIEGRDPTPSGNRHPEMAPHGIYPVEGLNGWIAIAVTNEVQWRSLLKLAGDAPFAGDPRFEQLAGRLEANRELDQLVAQWTMKQDASALIARLRGAGIAASSVDSLEQMWTNAHLQARQMSRAVEIPHYGSEQVFRAPWRFSAAHPVIDRPGPLTGEHNGRVFSDLLGMSPEVIANLVAEGVIA